MRTVLLSDHVGAVPRRPQRHQSRACAVAFAVRDGRANGPGGTRGKQPPKKIEQTHAGRIQRAWPAGCTTGPVPNVLLGMVCRGGHSRHEMDTMMRPRGNPAAFVLRRSRRRRTELVRPAGHVPHIVVGRANGSIPVCRSRASAFGPNVSEEFARNVWTGGDDPLRSAVPPVRHPGDRHALVLAGRLITGWQPDSQRASRLVG